ncbi:MAG: DNA replication/repair protein RecF [Verrucomicrobia bacterium]|nr:DNA replication/repair protein RecF [Verrucomicrobiota bacterium]
MFLKNLYLRNFRNYAEAQVEFHPKCNVLYGDNAQGKTNLLEAIYLIATGRSFRTMRAEELIRHGQSFFYIEATVVRDMISQTVKLSFDGESRRLQTEANTYSSFHHLLGLLPSVLYAPADTELITGSPAVRRRFFNLHLAQSDPLYVHHLSRYWRAMKQRNCLLRMRNEHDLECWEIEMAHSAAYLYTAREEMTAEIKEPLAKAAQRLSGDKESLELRFAPSYQPDTYLSQLKKSRPREVQLGLTMAGPHRDDLNLFIDGKPARLFASEGQKKTSMAALRLAEWERLCRRVEGTALMGIDDFGLHLDAPRQQLLCSSLDQLGQVFVTTPDHFSRNGWKLLEAAHRIKIESGSIA